MVLSNLFLKNSFKRKYKNSKRQNDLQTTFSHSPNEQTAYDIVQSDLRSEFRLSLSHRIYSSAKKSAHYETSSTRKCIYGVLAI